jgi:hypothetical protein
MPRTDVAGARSTPLQSLIARVDTDVQAASPSIAKPTASAVGSGGALRCQWCIEALPAGTSRCPSCGSNAIPDPVLSEDLPASVEAVVLEADPPAAQGELREWWRDDEAEEPDRKPRITPDEAERRTVVTITSLVGAAVFCIFIGWLIGPRFLEPLMENITGAPIDNPDDLRGLGAFIGLLGGLFIGATGGWIIWAD